MVLPSRFRAAFSASVGAGTATPAEAAGGCDAEDGGERGASGRLRCRRRRGRRRRYAAGSRRCVGGDLGRGHRCCGRNGRGPQEVRRKVMPAPRWERAGEVHRGERRHGTTGAATRRALGGGNLGVTGFPRRFDPFGNPLGVFFPRWLHPLGEPLGIFGRKTALVRASVFAQLPTCYGATSITRIDIQQRRARSIGELSPGTCARVTCRIPQSGDRRSDRLLGPR